MINITNWIKRLFSIQETQKYFWKEVKCEFLRKKIEFGIPDINYIYVYAITQICAETGASRMVERHSWVEIEEYNKMEHQEIMAQEARNTNNYNHI